MRRMSRPRPPAIARPPNGRSPRAVAPVSTRTLSLCPPLFPETTWGERLLDTVGRLVGPWRSPATRPDSSLDAPTQPWTSDDPDADSPVRRETRALQAEFAAAIADVADEDADALRTRVRQALGARELWNLRPAVFNVLSLHRGEAEAQRRVARLDRHFPRRVAGAPIAGWRRGR